MGTADIRFLLHNFLPMFWNTSVFWDLLGSCLFPLCMKFSCESMVRNGENVGNVSTLVTIVVFLGFDPLYSLPIGSIKLVETLNSFVLCYALFLFIKMQKMGIGVLLLFEPHPQA